MEKIFKNNHNQFNIQKNKLIKIKNDMSYKNAIYSNQWFVPSMRRIKFTFKYISKYSGGIAIGVVSKEHHLNKQMDPDKKGSILYYNQSGSIYVNGSRHGVSKLSFNNNDVISFIIDFISCVIC